MIISKAIELLTYPPCNDTILLTPDNKDALKLGIEALKRLEDIRKHPAHSVYGPLPGESMPERGIQAGMQITPKKKTG